jgi:hypothetical protein
MPLQTMVVLVLMTPSESAAMAVQGLKVEPGA